MGGFLAVCRLRGGMTLVELLLASTVTVLIAGSAMMVFRTTAGAQERIDRQMNLQHEARAGIDAIAVALRNAHRQADPQNADKQASGAGLLEGIDESSADAPTDRIRFMTISHRTIRAGQPESDVREVEFFLAPTPGDAASQGAWMLMRRTDPTRNARPDDGGVVERVASGVAGLDIEYHDGDAWRDRWRADLPTWPTAIRVRMVYAHEPASGGRRQTLTVSRLIGFLVPPPDEPTQTSAPLQPQEAGR